MNKPMAVLDTNILLNYIILDSKAIEIEAVEEVISILLKYGVNPNVINESDYSEIITDYVEERISINYNMSKFLRKIKSEFNLEFVITEMIFQEAIKYLEFDVNNYNIINWLSNNKTFKSTINKILFSRYKHKARHFLSNYRILPSPPKSNSFILPDFRSMSDAKIFDACIYNNVEAVATSNVKDFRILNNAHKHLLKHKLIILRPDLSTGDYKMLETLCSHNVPTALDIINLFEENALLLV